MSIVPASSARAALLSVILPLPVGKFDWSPLRDSLDRLDSDLWELVVVGGDASGTWSERVRRVSGPAATLGAALATGLAAAEGQFVAILGPDDAVDPRLLGQMQVTLDERPLVDIVYTDESFADGGRDFLKPDYSPERLRNQFYFGNVTLYNRGLLSRLEEPIGDLEGAELYELALRATRSASDVWHLRTVLCTSGPTPLQELWNPDFDRVEPALRAMLELHLAATGGGLVDRVRANGVHTTRRQVIGEPLVSIVIPTRGDTADVRGRERCMVVEAVRGVLEISTYTNVEFVVIIDDVAGDDVRQQLTDIAGERMRFVDWSGPFSFSGKMNLGVMHARGEFVLLLNDDVELITPGWIEAMLALAQLPNAGIVGSMLYFEDDTIQHAGHAYYRNDVTHIGLHSERGAAGPFGGFQIEREVAGDTGACALMTKALFIEAGGFSHLLPGNFNDVDLCMKVYALGYQSYWTPHAELYHFESKSRDPRVAAYEIDTAWGRWQHLLRDSPMWPTDPHELFPREPLDC